MDNIWKITSRLALDSKIQQTANVKGAYDANDQINLYHIYEEAQSINVSEAFIDDVFILFNNTQKVVSSRGNMTLEFFYNLYYKNDEFSYEDFRGYLGKFHYGDMIPLKLDSGKEVFLFTMGTLKSTFRESPAVVCCQISAETIKNRLQQMKWSDTMDVMLLTEQNVRVSANDMITGDTDWNYDQWEKGSHSQKNKVNEEYIVSVLPSEVLHWKYLSVLPVDQMKNNAEKVRTMTIVGLFVCILSGIFISYELTKKNYNPIKMLMDNFKNHGKVEIQEGENEYQWLNHQMDEFFRQHDPQYAAEHPEEHAAKEEIYENLMAGRISALDEKLAALGQTQEDYLPSEIEKFKDATGYEEFLDVDPQAIREAIENPDQSHVDEMLSFAEQANREYEAELYGQQAAPTPDDRETGETVRTPRGTFHVTDMSREQMEAAGYGFHHESEDGKYLIMANGSRAFAIPSGDAPEHTAPEKLTVLVVEPMKEPYVKEIDPGLHALQAEVGGDIAASYPFDDPVGLVLNDEGKLIGLDLNRSLRDEHGEIYDVMAGTFLVVGLSEDSFTSLTPEQVQKYTEHFKQPEQFISLNGQIIALPVEPENPLRTAEMTLEDDYGMIDGVLNNGRKGEELEKAQGEARRTTPEKKPSIRERLAEAKRECGERKPPDTKILF